MHAIIQSQYITCVCRGLYVVCGGVCACVVMVLVSVWWWWGTHEQVQLFACQSAQHNAGCCAHVKCLLLALPVHTDAHSLSLSHSLTHSLSLSLTLTLSCTHNHTPSHYALPHTITHNTLTVCSPTRVSRVTWWFSPTTPCSHSSASHRTQTQWWCSTTQH